MVNLININIIKYLYSHNVLSPRQTIYNTFIPYKYTRLYNNYMFYKIYY